METVLELFAAALLLGGILWGAEKIDNWRKAAAGKIYDWQQKTASRGEQPDERAVTLKANARTYPIDPNRWTPAQQSFGAGSSLLLGMLSLGRATGKLYCMRQGACPYCGTGVSYTREPDSLGQASFTCGSCGKPIIYEHLASRFYAAAPAHCSDVTREEAAEDLEALTIQRDYGIITPEQFVERKKSLTGPNTRGRSRRRKDLH